MVTSRKVLGLPLGYLVVKRAIDVTVSLLVLLVSSPLMAAIALAICVDSRGPVLYVSERTGQGGRRFRFYKFRTMRPDADAVKEQFRHLSVVPWPDFKLDPDPRVTRVGRFLRATSLDELPQLWNVVRGDMSLVGPRPTSMPPSVYSLHLTLRLEVRPGLTGAWQVFGRGTTDFDERLRIDAHYIRSMSLLTDLRLMVLTATSVVRREGA